MKDTRILSLAVVLILVTLIAVPAVQLYGFQKSVSSAASAAAPPMPAGPGIPYPNPKDGMNVTVLGIIEITTIAPVCSPSCAIQSSTISYLNVNGRNYRLLFSNSTTLQANVNGWNAVSLEPFTRHQTFNLTNGHLHCPSTATSMFET
ncbi:MAG TPA: hypothetical protein VK503_04590 [Candidatus Bathyarchaeia archaeon]|nr:hypothetical protein [Candidatus Bathyarchaeia archaeon]